MSADLVAIENRLWAAADQLWANTGLKPAEFSTPVLGLIFLRYADKRFGECATLLHARGIPAGEREPVDYQAEGVLYLPDEARFSHLLTLTEGANLGKAIANAMALVEEHNPELRGVLPRGYNLLPNATLVELLRLLSTLDLEGDAFGKVYEYLTFRSDHALPGEWKDRFRSIPAHRRGHCIRINRVHRAAVQDPDARVCVFAGPVGPIPRQRDQEHVRRLRAAASQRGVL